MTTSTVSSGVTSTGITVSNGDTWIIDGTAVSFTVSNGGAEVVSSGGTARSTTLNGGDEYVFASGTTSDTTVIGGTAYLDGGTAISTTLDGGDLRVQSTGAVAIGTTVNDGGAEYVGTGNSATDTTVNSGGAEFVYGGTTVVSTTVAIGGMIEVPTLAYVPGGTANVDSTTDVLTVSVGGNTYTQQLAGDYTDAYFQLAAGAGTKLTLVEGTPVTTAFTVPSGVTSTGITVSNGDSWIIDGTAVSFTISNGGTEIVSSGGTASSTLNDGNEYVYAGGTTSDATVIGGIEYLDGGTAISTTLDGGTLRLQSTGGVAIGTTVNNGGAEYVGTGNSATDTTVNSGGTEFVYGGTTVISTTVALGGMIEVPTLAYVPGGTANVDSTTDVLTVSVGGNTYTQQLAGDYTDAYFQLAPGAGTLLTLVEGTPVTTTFTVSTGVTSTGITVSGGDTWIIDGTAVSFTISSSGTEAVSSGGSAVSTTVSNGGFEYVYSGGTTSLTTVSNGGTEFVSSGGTARSTTLNDADEYVFVSGTTSDTTVIGGIEYLDGGTAISTTLDGGDLRIQSTGGVAIGTTVNNGGAEYVGTGNSATDTTVNSGGTEFVYGGTTVISTTVALGGMIEVPTLAYVPGGTANVDSTTDVLTVSVGGNTYTQQLAGDYTDAYFQLAAGAGTKLTLVEGTPVTITSTVSAGVTSTGITVSGGDSWIIDGTAVSFTISSGGTEAVSSGGSAVSTTVSNGGFEYVYSGGTASLTRVSGGGTETLSGGTTVSTTLRYNGQQFVYAGGATSFTAVSYGGREVVSSGGSAVSTILNNGGAEFVSSGGKAVSTTVSSGGYDVVSSGGSASFTTVSGGYEVVSKGGTATSTTLRNGGQELVYSGGTTSFTTLSDGGSQGVSSGGTAVSTTVSNGGAEIVYPDGTDSFTTVSSGGTESVEGSGIASSTMVRSGGSELVVGFGTAISTTIALGGKIELLDLQNYLPGGTATVDSTTDVLTVSVGGQSYTQQLAGDYTGEQFQLAPGPFGGTQLTLAVAQVATTYSVTSGMTSTGITLGYGDVEHVYFSGSAVSTIVNNGGTEFVSSGGTAVSTTVSSGGYEVVSNGGTATSTTLRDGGQELVYSGGTTSFTTLSDGGSQGVSSGGTAVSTTVSNGGAEIVYPGGTDSFTTVSSGGTESVEGSGIASSTMVRSGGSELVVGFGTAISTTIALGGKIELLDLQNYLPGGTATVDSATDVLTVSVGGQSYTQQLAGDYTGEQFQLAPGPFGGTQLTLAVAQVATTYSVTSGVTSTGITLGYGDVEHVYFSGSAVGTIVNYGGTEFVSSGGTAVSTTVSSGGYEVVSNGGTATSTTLRNGGQELVYSGGTTSFTTLSDGGSQGVSSGGTAVSTTVSNGGAEIVYPGGTDSFTTVSSGGTESVEGSGIASSTMVRSGGSELVVGFGTAISTTIALGGKIELLDLQNYLPGGTATVNPSTDVLTVSVGGQRYTQQLAGDYTDEYFQLAPGPSGGTQLTLAEGTPCYCRGTRILTHRGEIAVEDLRIGDRLKTLSGAMRKLRWIGRRSYAGRFAAANPDILPVLIRRDALADGKPRRDLYVSPLHAMYLDDVLIPAVLLVNGASIQQVAAIEQVEYFHLELATHDIILAEGAASETFVDDDSRGMFHNAAEYRQLYPDAPQVPARFCAQRVEDGEVLEAVRQRLAARARPQRPDGGAMPPGKLLGFLTHVGLDRIAGWARDVASPNQPVWLRVLDNDAVIGLVVADRHREMQRQNGLGEGRCGFEISIPGGLSPLTRHVIRVVRAADGAELPTSPRVVEAAPVAATGASAPVGTLRGQLDRATRERISGWAQDAAAPEAPVALQVIDNGVPIMRVLANLARADLAVAGMGSGRHSFDVIVPGGLSPLVRHILHVRREADGTELPGSPMVIEATGGFDAGLQQAIASAVAAIGSDDDRDRALAFIMEQTDLLLQQRADAESHRDARVGRRRLVGSWGKSVQGATAAERAGRRALVIDERVPRMGRDAGSQALLSHMRALQRLGYAVSFVAAEEVAGDEADFEALTASGVACCAAPFYASVEDALRRQAACFDLVYLHRAGIASRYLALARRYMPRARILYSVADLHHVRLERQAAVEERPELLTESRRVRLEECMAAWLADGVITHSADEAALLRRAVPGASVYRVPWEVSGAGVDATGDAARGGALVGRALAGRALVGRAAAGGAGVTPFAARRGLVFVGSFAHTPNVDAACWLVETVMPLVRQVDPDIVCLLVGSAMPDVVWRLAGPGVVPLGEVADLGSVFGRVRLSVAPLRYGAGVKGKVLDSLAASVPCVMSPIAAEGLGLPAGLRALVAEDAARFAKLICRLHRSEAAHRKAVLAGQSMIRKDHSEAVVTAAMQAAIEGRGLAVGSLTAGTGNSGAGTNPAVPAGQRGVKGVVRPRRVA